MNLSIFKQDLLFLWLMATSAVCLGLLFNQFRDAPLPLLYQNKEERLQVAVTRLATPEVSSEMIPQQEMLPEFLSLEEFQDFWENASGLVLDARPEIFHRLGHVPGALSLARDDFENAYTQLREQLERDKTQPLAVYCASASCQDSELVKNSLVALGYTNIAIFKGGWSEWTAAGKPEENTP